MSEVRAPADDARQNKIFEITLRFLQVAVFIGSCLALVYGREGTFFISLIALVLMFMPEYVSGKFGIKLPLEFSLIIAVFLFASLFLGEVGQVYERFWWWDGALHLMSGFVLGYAGFLFLYVNLKRHKIQASPFFVGAIIFSFALAAGTLWEIFEYAMDSNFGFNMQKTGLRDTMWDLIVDGIGALAIAIIGARYIKKGGVGFVARWTERFMKHNPALKS